MSRRGDRLAQGTSPQLGPGAVRAALALGRSGVVFDLDIGRFAGMAHNPAQPGLDIVTYRSPRGLANDRRSPNNGGSPPDEDNFGFVLELVTTSMHMGTHLDALSHITAGEDNHGHSGFLADEHVGDKGVLVADVTTVPPILARGVLLDVAGALGVERLEPGYAISRAELEQVREAAAVSLDPGDVVLVRTGHLKDWPVYEPGPEPGLSLEAALWLADHHPIAIGADNSAVEVLPSVIPGRLQPVHVELVVNRGLYLIEWLGLEELAAAGYHEFLFIALPLKIKGATGSLLRPVAVV